jgi:hypothetical protein
VTLPPIVLPPVKLLLEVDRESLLTIGDRVRDTVYNAALAGLGAAVEDFAADQQASADDVDGRSDGGVVEPVAGP